MTTDKKKPKKKGKKKVSRQEKEVSPVAEDDTFKSSKDFSIQYQSNNQYIFNQKQLDGFGTMESSSLSQDKEH